MSKPVAHYSASYKAGDLLFVSGQVGISEGSLADGVAAQTTQALANAESVLSENGLTLADVVKCTVFMTDIENFSIVLFSVLSDKNIKTIIVDINNWVFIE